MYRKRARGFDFCIVWTFFSFILQVCALIWILGLFLVFPPFVGWSKFVVEGIGTSCSWDYTSRDYRNRLYYIFLLTFGFIIPVSVIIISYVGILQIFCKQSYRMHGISRNGGLSKKHPTRSELKTVQASLSSSASLHNRQMCIP